MNPGHGIEDNMEHDPTRRLNHAARMHGTDRRASLGQPRPQAGQDHQSQAWTPQARKKDPTDKHSVGPSEAGRSKPPDGQHNRPARSRPNKGGGVKKVSVRIGLGREVPALQPLTECVVPLEIEQKVNPLPAGGVCAYAQCENSLPPNPRARYCCRSHKELAKQRRGAERHNLTPRVAFCSLCGQRISVWSRRGRLPKYCPAHHPKQPCAGCGKLLRHHAVTSTCRDCTPRRERAGEKVWTCLCRLCGSLFDGPPHTEICQQHTPKSKENQ